MSNFKYAFRTLRINPGFALTAVLTLALGIGANTAIFSLVDRYLLQPLPYPEPDRLVVLWESTQEGGRGSVAMANFYDWVKQSASFQSLAAWTPTQVDLRMGQYTERAQGEVVTPAYFPLLGVRPQLGRDFGSDEDLPHTSAIVSDAFWRSQMGASPSAVGQTVTLGGALFTVVGVGPKGFSGLSGHAEFWAPIAAYNLMYPQHAAMDFPHSRDVRFMQGLGRLRAGAAVASAAAEMKALGERLEKQYPNENRNRGIALAAAHDDMSRNVRPALEALFAGVGLVLLVATANVANLVLVRLSRRSHEIAVRTALGASRWHLLKQLWSETAVVAAAGATFGLAIFFALQKSWNAVLPLDLPRYGSSQVDSRLLLFAFGLTLMTGLVLALFPVMQLGRRGVQPQISSGSRSSDSRSTSKLREVLAGGEVALAVVLTAGAGLMVKSLWTLQHTDPGFSSEHLATLRFDIPTSGYSDQTRHTLPERLAERLQTVPGVESTAASTADLLVWPGINRGFEIEGHEAYRNQFSVYFQNVTPGFFQAMGIPLLKGRDFAASDNQNSQSVIVVSQAFARRYLPGQDPIGKRLRMGGPQKDWRVIVAVVGDAQMEDVHRSKSDVCFFYSPMRTAEVVDVLSVVVRTAGNPADLLGALRAEVQRFDPNLTIFGVSTAQQRIASGIAGTRSFTLLMALFGTVAVGLALLGTFGVISYSASQRMREVGIRLALGAQHEDIVRLIMMQALGFVSAGLGIGVALSVAATPVLSAMLVKVKARDPLVLTATAVLVAIAAVAASYFPAWRAARLEVTTALRQD